MHLKSKLQDVILKLNYSFTLSKRMYKLLELHNTQKNMKASSIVCYYLVLLGTFVRTKNDRPKECNCKNKYDDIIFAKKESGCV